MVLTKKAKRYAEIRASGKFKTKRDCAIAAGCPESSASQAASRYEKNDKVLEYWEMIGFNPESDDGFYDEQARIVELVTDKLTKKERVKEIIKKKDYGEAAIEYLLDVVLDNAEDPRLKVESAKFLAKHKLNVEKHKPKEKKTESSRFGAVAPPKLKSVK